MVEKTEAKAGGMALTAKTIADLPVALDRDVFLRKLISQLAGTLQDVVGQREAEGFVSVVGEHIGDMLDSDYRKALSVERLSREQVAAVLVDLKRRIQGDFFILEETPERLVLGNRACPFGALVHNRTALCMMTANVFGRIVAANLGYAKVQLEETIAQGHPGCRVVIHLKPVEEKAGAANRLDARDFFGETFEA